MNYTNDQNSESQLKKEVDYKEEQINKLKSIKICAYWQIFGWLIFILPGFIAMILLVIKLFSYIYFLNTDWMCKYQYLNTD